MRDAGVELIEHVERLGIQSVRERILDQVVR